MTSKAVLMKAFFTQFTSFATELTEMYPNDPDFSMFLNAIQIAKTANPAMVIRTVSANVAGFEDKIMAMDESFFMSHSFEKDYGEYVSDINVFGKLKQYIQDMSPASKANVWKYIQNIMRLAQACA